MGGGNAIFSVVFLVQFQSCPLAGGWWRIGHIGLSRLMTANYCLWFVTVLRHGDDRYDEDEDDDDDYDNDD